VFPVLCDTPTSSSTCHEVERLKPLPWEKFRIDPSQQRVVRLAADGYGGLDLLTGCVIFDQDNWRCEGVLNPRQFRRYEMKDGKLELMLTQTANRSRRGLFRGK
jgi:hypothetical protein